MNISRSHGVLPLATRLWRARLLRRSLHSSSRPANTTDTARTPKPPVELDPALQALLRDADHSLLHARKHRTGEHGRVHRELEVVDDVDVDADAGLNVPAPPTTFDGEEAASEARLFPHNERKSPAASFGSRRIGAVVLPFELQRSILRLLSEADKPIVHVDAARLFQEENTVEDAWSTRYTPPAYTVPSAGSRRSHIQARLARHRDGTAFASVVMPAQYAVVAAVLANVVTRLGEEWARGVDRVVDWGSGTGAGMWAALHTFGGAANAEGTLAASSVSSYIGIEKRDGLTTIARRLLRDIPLGRTTVSFQKTLHTSDHVPRDDEGLGTIALSSFLLSTLATPGLRRQIVREMWDSGADVIVIIDDASVEGFRHVVDARELLLKFGRREIQAAEAEAEEEGSAQHVVVGAHVIAPCPHDSACPLALASGPAVRCTFEQRLQRPSFVRRTKHAGVGEEDVGYSYVVVRRGLRPVPGSSSVVHVEAKVEGRMGAVGRWAEEAARAKEVAREEQAVQQARWAGAVDEEEAEASDEVEDAGDAEAGVVEAAAADDAVQSANIADIDEGMTNVEDAVAETALMDQELEDALRLEAYTWPRINFPPLKRSGHILIDACMPNGKEMRLTFPRSQGKQIYYDARKSAWGDLFPHAPKHRPVPRYTAGTAGTAAAAGPKQDGSDDVKKGAGGDGALAKVGLRAAGRARWSPVMDSLREQDRRRRRERRTGRGTKEMRPEEEDEEEEEG